MRGTIRFLLENSLFLIFGAVAALIWANTDLESYAHFQHIELFHSSWVGYPHGAERIFTLHFLVNDVLMALFFAIAALHSRYSVDEWCERRGRPLRAGHKPSSVTRARSPEHGGWSFI